MMLKERIDETNDTLEENGINFRVSNFNELDKEAATSIYSDIDTLRRILDRKELPEYKEKLVRDKLFTVEKMLDRECIRRFQDS